jgi:hypothetical protein
LVRYETHFVTLSSEFKITAIRELWPTTDIESNVEQTMKCLATVAQEPLQGAITMVEHHRGYVLTGKLKQEDCLPTMQCVPSANVWCEQAMKAHQLLCQMITVTGLTYSKNGHFTHSVVISPLACE